MGKLMIVYAFFVDVVIGDPVWIPHPVVMIGRLISATEKLLRNREEKHRRNQIKYEYVMGGILTFVVLLVTLGVTGGLLYVINMIKQVNSTISDILLVYFASTTIAFHGLIKSGYKVITALENNDIVEARYAVSRIVGRETSQMTTHDISRATIESLAENLSDGVIAPLFYMAIGGIPLAMLYKAINTMDSMIGYKNERYRHFGFIAARLDDVFNFIPARITGIMIVISSFVIRLYKGLSESTRTFKSALSTLISDGRKHPSPNSGIPEAATAGALGIQLGGPAVYNGTVVIKPYIGSGSAPDVRSIYHTIYLVIVATIITLTTFAFVIYYSASVMSGKFL